MFSSAGALLVSSISARVFRKLQVNLETEVKVLKERHVNPNLSYPYSRYTYRGYYGNCLRSHPVAEDVWRVPAKVTSRLNNLEKSQVSISSCLAVETSPCESRRRCYDLSV